jgi:hypothetical protein
MNYTKEQAEQVLKDYNQFHRQSGLWCDKDFINHKFPSLEVGKWYWVDNGLANELLICQQRNNPAFGFTSGGDFCDDMGNICVAQPYRLATDKEVEEALIAEAKRRGFKEGVKYKDINDKCIYPCQEEFELIDGKLMCTVGGGWIFLNGEWAEILVDPIKDKINELEATINKAQQEIKELKGLHK